MLMLLPVEIPRSVSPTATTPGIRFISETKLAPADILDLEDMIALEARIDGAGEDGLRIDDGGADDEAGRDCELKQDERRAKPPRARRFGRRPVRLEHLGRLEARDEDRGIKAADDTDEEGQDDGRKQDTARTQVIYGDVGIEERGEWPHQQLDEGKRQKHRGRGNQDRLADELDDELAAVGA